MVEIIQKAMFGSYDVIDQILIVQDFGNHHDTENPDAVDLREDFYGDIRELEHAGCLMRAAGLVGMCSLSL